MRDSQEDVSPLSGAGRSGYEEAPYEGALSKTTIETIHVPTRDGALRSVEVYRVINVLTDPALREAALSGRLHSLESGESVAFSFVYHDPTLCKYALVVPESSRHHVMREHAKLLSALAEDTTHAIPHYVHACAVLVGYEALRRYVEETFSTPNSEAIADQDSHTSSEQIESAQGQERIDELRGLLADREKRLRGREERIRVRAERLTAREDELRTLEERLVGWERDLMMREHLLVARERNLADGLTVDGPALESEVQDIDQEYEDDDDGLESADQYGAFRTSPHLPLSDSVELLDEAGPQDVAASASASVDGTAVEDDDQDDEEEQDASDQDVEDVLPGDAETEGGYEGPRSAVHPLIGTQGVGEAEPASDAQLETPELAALLADPSAAPSQIASLVASFVLLGERAIGPLIESLSAPKGVIRHACALALGELRVRHAIQPLVDLLREEKTEVWQELARLLPLFGAPAFRACLREVEEGAHGNEDRFAYAFAHFAEQGYGRRVEQLRTGSNARIAKVARDASGHGETASRHEQMVRGDIPVEPGDAMRAFSRLFYAELAKARGNLDPVR